MVKIKQIPDELRSMKESAYQHRVTVIVKVLLVLAAYHLSLFPSSAKENMIGA